MITWKDLSWQLKVAIVGGWVTVLIYSIYTIVGFIYGVTG